MGLRQKAFDALAGLLAGTDEEMVFSVGALFEENKAKGRALRRDAAFIRVYAVGCIGFAAAVEWYRDRRCKQRPARRYARAFWRGQAGRGSTTRRSACCG